MTKATGVGTGNGATRRWTVSETEYLRENYDRMSAPDIAAALGRTLTGVHVRASKLGLQALHRSGFNSLRADYFKAIDTPMKAYVLGLLASDGFICNGKQVCIALRDYDRELVELVRDELAPKARLAEYQTRYDTTMVRFGVGSLSMVADLAAHGIVSRKSQILRWPATVPPEFEGSFLCGMSDGDGSLELSPILHWSLVGGSIGMLGDIQRKVAAHTDVKVGGPYPDRRPDHNCWRVAVTGRPVRALDAWMHRDVRGLARKRIPASDQGALF